MSDYTPQRYITTWRKTPTEGSILDWDYYVSFSLKEAEEVVYNLKARGVTQWRTYPMGEDIKELCSEF